MTEMHHYTESGLPDVWLANGFVREETAYGPATSIEDVDGLHHAIATDLVADKRPLSGAGVRFLRKEMGMSQAALARCLGISDQTVARWEKGETSVDPIGDRLVRLMWSDYAKADPHILDVLRELAEMDEQAHGRRVLEKDQRNWRMAA